VRRPFFLSMESGNSEDLVRLNRRGLGTLCAQSRVLMALALLVAGATVLWLGSGVDQPHLAGQPVAIPALFDPATSTRGQQQIRVAYGHLPLIFEPNRGQSDPRVKFLARSSGYGLFLTADEAVLSLQSSVVSRRSSGKAASVLRMQLAGADADAAIIGADRLPGRSNYLIGNDPAKWHRNVPQFARVRYGSVYPGIDLVYYGNQGRLEYDFEVSPGADPKQVALRFQGPEKIELDASGDLVLATNGGDVRLQAPRVYQKIGEEQRPVAGRFVLRAKDHVGFEVGAYDRSRTLVIDPVLTYSSYLGGSGEEACSAITLLPVASGCPAVAVDSATGIGGPGNIYLAGSTSSTDFPTTTGVFQPAIAAGATANIFVSKLDPSGATLIFSTYLGGDGVDTSAGIAVDSALNVYVAGTTSSSNFPTTSNAFQPAPLAAGNHAFASELQPDGTALLYSTYLGGTGTDAATGLALDFRAKMYISGTTTSSDFPFTPGAIQTTSKASNQFFFTKLDPAASSGPASLAYSTYIGGSNPAAGQTMGGGIAVDNNSGTANVYLTGGTDFTDMPALNAAQGALAGGLDAWVAKINPTAASGSQLLYLTYLGGTGDDVGTGVAVDGSFNTYVTGSTTSPDMVIPTGTTPFQKCLDDPTNPATCPTGVTASDAFVAKIGNPVSGSSTFPLNYFSYLGGSGDDAGLAIAVDSIQGARITGSTTSADFPVPNNPVQPTLGGGTDAFAARIDTTATTANAAGHSGTYLGGTVNDAGTAISLDTQGNSYVAGETASVDFPTQNPFQATLNGTSDAFVTKLGPVVNLAMAASVCTTPPCPPVGVGNQVAYKFVITNNGDLTSGITFLDTLPATGATFVSAAASPGSCGGVNSNTVSCNIGTLNGGATATVTITLTPTSAPTTLTNSATASVAGSSFTSSASASATVNDYSVSVAPASVTVAAGAAATYTATVATIPQNSAIPNSVSLSCSSGLPSGATCEFTNNPIPDLNTGSQSRALAINTTARPKPIANLHSSGGVFYASWLPISGLTLLGLGLGGKTSRRRRALLGLLLGGFFALILFQAGCGASSTTTTTTGGTPAGTYTVTVTATSGSATRTSTLELVVQ